MSNMEKLNISKAIIVEGKYDKIKLQSIINGVIIETNGFRVFKDKEKQALIKELANKNGIIILTDSDVAGFKLRNFIKSLAKDAEITNLYIPQIKGKEKRKVAPSKEEFFGVEGIEQNILRELFSNVSIATDEKERIRITKMDFFEDGLSGGENSTQKRQALLKYLNMPNYITVNSLIEVINSLISYEEYKEFIKNSKV